ncbi:MAG: Txe/YoeB family addiction module toxin [Bacteroidales bacterium]|nr:Txe/YoeB family addiction module toxin [Bacteroidales bacterium]
MSTYAINYLDQATEDLLRLRKSEPKAYKKVSKLIEELKQHPKTGTGHPEQLKGNRSNQWSRRITDKHRLVYEIRDTEVIVIVVAAYGHYDDK